MSMRHQRMARRGIAPFATVLAALASLSAAPMQDSSSIPAQDAPPTRPLPSRDPLVPRLEALDPSRPLEYLDLAEDVQASAKSDDDRRMARTLYGLAGAIDPGRLGASAALGQATLAESPAQKSRLLRLAAALGGSARGNDASREPPTASIKFAQLMAAYRRGDGTRARELLNGVEVAAQLEIYGAAFEGGATGFRNAVAAMRDRPLDSEARRLESMFLEQALLSGGRSFASDLIRSNAEALAACDPLNPGPEFGVDRTKSLWRNGRWIARDAAP